MAGLKYVGAKEGKNVTPGVVVKITAGDVVVLTVETCVPPLIVIVLLLKLKFWIRNVINPWAATAGRRVIP